MPPAPCLWVSDPRRPFSLGMNPSVSCTLLPASGHTRRPWGASCTSHVDLLKQPGACHVSPRTTPFPAEKEVPSTPWTWTKPGFVLDRTHMATSARPTDQEGRAQPEGRAPAGRTAAPWRPFSAGIGEVGDASPYLTGWQVWASFCEHAASTSVLGSCLGLGLFLRCPAATLHLQSMSTPISWPRAHLTRQWRG